MSISITQDEHAEQAALIEWVGIRAIRDDRYNMIYAIPNGGHRHPYVGARLRAEGVRPGILDINIDVPMDPWHGMRLELKAGRGTLSDDQRKWMRRFQQYGYWATVIWGWTEAAITIMKYFNEPEKEIERQRKMLG